MISPREEIIREIKRLERELQLAYWHLDKIDNKKPRPPEMESDYRKLIREAAERENKRVAEFKARASAQR